MIYLIGFICHLTYILFDYFYFFTFFLDLNRLFAILEVITITNKLKKEMQDKKPLILLNTTPESNPTYRVLLQTPRELPAYDMGYNSIKYNPDTIKSKIKQLEGQFIYDETQTAHNKRKTPENRGHRFAKVINTGYCPEYGGYGDITVFDSDYHDLLKEVYESTRDGLPVHEGISTELDPIDAHTTNDGGGWWLMTGTMLDWCGIRTHVIMWVFVKF
jgi:hypothetical protein